ncbi:MAG TPA: trehalose-phosphatase, partial [Candidatus Polarisedimenticolia bacterium]|nr:trehalose-phosphatase [Candidatus Polarisedimenticolia bacterium]
MLVLDYDGTLAPHRRRLAPVAPIDGALRRLERLSRRPGTTLAIVSGRRADDLQLLLGGLHALRVAEHGWDEIGPDGRRLAHPLPLATRRALAAAARAIATLPDDI